MEPRKNPWIWGLLLLGLGLIVLSQFFGRHIRPRTDLSSPLARVERLTGHASVVRNGLFHKEPLDRRISLGHLDSVETGDLGEARLDFESAYRVRVKEHSFVTLEKVSDSNGFHVVLILKRGRIEIENFGRDGDLFIAKNGERISATDYQESPLARAPVQSSAPPSSPLPPAPDGTGLSEKEIQDVMNSHRTSFQKCYTQLLQKDPNARGEVSLAFTIENNGKMSAVDATSKALTQEDFKKCLLDVMSRVEFRVFRGPPVSTLFPLKFE